MDIEKVDIENMDIESPHPALILTCKILNVIVTFLLKFMCNAFRFSMYLVNLTLLMFSNLIERYCLDNWDWYQKRLEYLSEDDTDEAAPVDIEFYDIKRSGDFNKIYNDLKSNISVTKETDIVLDEKTSKDIVNKVEKLVTIIEKDSVTEGYEFARDTECKLASNEVYKKYILKKVLEG